MSDLLQIGASGVRAYQSALGTVGENIANAGTDGYSRRVTTLNEISSIDGFNKNNPGMGVTVGAQTRATNGYATASVRAATSDLSRTESSATWLTDIQSALTGNDVTARTTAFFAASSSLAADPTSTALRATLLGTATSTAAAFTATGQSLAEIDTQIDTGATQAASTLTGLGASLAKVNEGLGKTQAGTSGAAQLADQRDQLLAQMSALATVSSTTDSLGRATVKLGGASGTTLVAGAVAGAVNYGRDSTGQPAFSVYFDGEVSGLTTDGGAIAGMVEGAQKVAAARDTLNAVASGFVSTVNAVQAQGDDLNGNAGQPIFATGAKATDISVAMTDGSGIAAAARGGGERDASNLSSLQTARDANGYETSLTALTTTTATAIAQKNTIADAQSSIKSGAETALTDATGVSLDSEAIDLVRFQQAYSASSRIIQVARETFQSILDIR